MESSCYRFSVGEFTCYALRDGLYHYPPELFFGNVARDVREGALRERGLPVDRIATPYTILLIDTGEQRVLVDTGAGNLGASAVLTYPGIDHSGTETGFLAESLRSAGYEPGDINTVLITHAHPDHVGGTLDSIGRLVFANAQYFIARAEWEFWLSEGANRASAAMVTIARRNLRALRGRLTLVKEGTEVTPGIRVVGATGHTPGHLAVSITSAGQELVHIADTALHPLHLEHPEWQPKLDLGPQEALASKQRLLNWAANAHALVFAHHFAPFPALGRVHRQESGWRWEPVETAGSEMG
jgi:glyoxylase-like metal-dependent hydrolase (beta-lactamase superfamily II)